MDWSQHVELFGKVALSVGAITPLILGLLLHFRDRKKASTQETAAVVEAVVMGDHVDFESVAIKALGDRIKDKDRDLSEKRAEIAELKARVGRRDATIARLRGEVASLKPDA